MERNTDSKRVSSAMAVNSVPQDIMGFAKVPSRVSSDDCVRHLFRVVTKSLGRATEWSRVYFGSWFEGLVPSDWEGMMSEMSASSGHQSSRVFSQNLTGGKRRRESVAVAVVFSYLPVTGRDISPWGRHTQGVSSFPQLIAVEAPSWKRPHRHA